MSPHSDPERADAPDPESRDPDDARDPIEDPETTTASDRTREIIHDLAIGLNKLGKRIAELREEAAKQADLAAARAKEATERARESPAGKRAEEMARTGATRASETARHAAESARHAATSARTAADTARERSRDAVVAADEALSKARAIALGLVTKAESATEQAAERIQQRVDELQERARRTAEAGRDFYQEHREEILALLFTAAKVAAVIGIRRLAASRDEDEKEEDIAASEKRRKADTTRRIIDSVTLLTAVVGQLGRLLAKQPSTLPMLREMYARGEPSEQAVVGMLLGPALSSDPDHAVDVVQEFLEGATTGSAADTIARRTLAPLLAEHPELVDKVTPWVQAAAPFVRRAALLALGRFVADRKSRLGDILAAAVVVLEDHDEEVRRALSRLIQRAASIDPEATAKAIAERLDSEDPEARARAQEVVDTLPESLQDRIDAARSGSEDKEQE